MADTVGTNILYREDLSVLVPQYNVVQNAFETFGGGNGSGHGSASVNLTPIIERRLNFTLPLNEILKRVYFVLRGNVSIRPDPSITGADFGRILQDGSSRTFANNTFWGVGRSPIPINIDPSFTEAAFEAAYNRFFIGDGTFEYCNVVPAQAPSNRATLTDYRNAALFASTEAWDITRAMVSDKDLWLNLIIRESVNYQARITPGAVADTSWPFDIAGEIIFEFQDWTNEIAPLVAFGREGDIRQTKIAVEALYDRSSAPATSVTIPANSLVTVEVPGARLTAGKELFLYGTNVEDVLFRADAVLAKTAFAGGAQFPDDGNFVSYSLYVNGSYREDIRIGHKPDGTVLAAPENPQSVALTGLQVVEALPKTVALKADISRVQEDVRNAEEDIYVEIYDNTTVGTAIPALELNAPGFTVYQGYSWTTANAASPLDTVVFEGDTSDGHFVVRVEGPDFQGIVAQDPADTAFTSSQYYKDYRTTGDGELRVGKKITNTAGMGTVQWALQAVGERITNLRMYTRASKPKPSVGSVFGDLIATSAVLPTTATARNIQADWVLNKTGAGYTVSDTNVNLPRIPPDDAIWGIVVKALVDGVEVDRATMPWGPGNIETEGEQFEEAVSPIALSSSSRIYVKYFQGPNSIATSVVVRGFSQVLPANTTIEVYEASVVSGIVRTGLEFFEATAPLSLAQADYAVGAEQTLAIGSADIDNGMGIAIASNRVTVSPGTQDSVYTVVYSVEVEARTFETSATDPGNRLEVEVFAKINGVIDPTSYATHYFRGPTAYTSGIKHYQGVVNAKLVAGDYITFHAERIGFKDTNGAAVDAWRINASGSALKIHSWDGMHIASGATGLTAAQIDARADDRIDAKVPVWARDNTTHIPGNPKLLEAAKSDFDITDVTNPGYIKGWDVELVVNLLQTAMGSNRLSASAIQGLPVVMSIAQIILGIEAQSGNDRLDARTLRELPVAQTIAEIVAGIEGLKDGNRLDARTLRELPMAWTIAAIISGIEARTGNDRLDARTLRELPSGGGGGLTITQIVAGLQALTGSARLSFFSLKDVPTSIADIADLESKVQELEYLVAVSYTHLTLPTKRIV